MKKLYKGMTLVEVIVALALFSIIMLIVATVFSATAMLNSKTVKLNNKIERQAISIVYPTVDDKTTADSIEIAGEDFDINIIEVDGNKTYDGAPNIRYISVP